MSDKPELPGNFADYPLSMTEIKAEREGDMRIWTPRDVLIDLLRRIDSGDLVTDAMVVSFRRVDGDDYYTNFAMASPDLHTSLGLLSRTAHQMNDR